MQINYLNKTIHCFYCHKDLRMEEIFLDVLYEGSITCEKNHLIGNQSDKEWLWLTSNCPYFYVYHNEGQCRCIQEKTNCNGQEENCENLLGKKSYEEDLEEKNG